jgi:hypothetical protein
VNNASLVINHALSKMDLLNRGNKKRK